MPQRVGVLGGTFDPVHIGHLRVAEEALEDLNLDKILFIPSASPPHKPGKKILPFDHRFRMLQLALKGHPRFELSDIERRLPGVSYSVITLRKIREDIHWEIDLYFLVGLDAFLEMNTWWHFRELFQLAHLAVFQRPGFKTEDVGLFLGEKVSPLYVPDTDAGSFKHPDLFPVHTLRNTHLGISSTRIRQLAAEGRSIRYLVLSEVMRYIQKKKLYQSDAPESL